LRKQCRSCRSLAPEQFGDTEIQQLCLPIVSDEHVGGLEVAMNDEIGMGQGDSASHIEEKTDARIHVEAAFIGVFINMVSFHVFENQIRFSIGSDSGIDQFRDVRMRKLAENPAFPREPFRTACRGNRKTGSDKV
jgi:hypothetical protein